MARVIWTSPPKDLRIVAAKSTVIVKVEKDGKETEVEKQVQTFTLERKSGANALGEEIWVLQNASGATAALRDALGAALSRK